MSNPRPAQFANLYSHVGVTSQLGVASPHQLVQMLFDGFAESVRLARAAMQAGQVETKGRAINKAVRILDEGLKAGLNLEAGGDLARDLADLYVYVTLKLTLANMRNDLAALDEAERLMEPLRQAWTAIGPQVDGGAAA